MNLIEALQAMKEGKKVRDIRKENYMEKEDDGLVVIKSFKGKEIGHLGLSKIDLTTDVFEIYEGPILDAGEKAYLEAVSRPFKEKIRHIKKGEVFSGDEFIGISVENFYHGNCNILFPVFKKGTMYKGMELNKEYTLKELGLFIGK